MQQHCRNCGALLSPESQACASCGMPAQPVQYMAPLPDGASQPPAYPANPPVHPPARRASRRPGGKRGLLYALVAVLLIVLIVIIGALVAVISSSASAA